MFAGSIFAASQSGRKPGMFEVPLDGTTSPQDLPSGDMPLGLALKMDRRMCLVDLFRLSARAKGLYYGKESQLGSTARKRKACEQIQSLSVFSGSSLTSPQKKPKKKWLPPLGPPEAESAAILGKRKADARAYTKAATISAASDLRN